MKEYAHPVAYIRKSTVGGADSREDQKRDVLALVTEIDPENAARIEMLDGDWAISARREKVAKRKALAELLRALEAGEVSALYAKSLDRLARDVESASRILNACERAGVPIHLLIPRMTYDASNAMHRFTFQNQAIMAEQAVMMDIAKAAGRVTRQRERGLKLGQKPYGARPGEDVQAVISAFKAAGTYHGAARELAARGVPSRRCHLPNTRDGTTDGARGAMQGWSASTIKRIVLREAPDLVPVDTTGTRGKRATQRWRFSRLLICPHDGSTLTTIPHKGRGPSYACRIGHRSPAGQHPRPWVISERYILPWAKAEMAHRLKVTAEAIDGDGVQRSLTDLAAKRERVIEMYAEGIIDKAARDKRLAGLDAQRNDLDALKRRRVTIESGMDWDADPAEVNARLREWWSHVELEYVPADQSAPMIGRNDRSRELDLRPARAEWRKGPLVIPPAEQPGEERVHVSHPVDVDLPEMIPAEYGPLPEDDDR